MRSIVGIALLWLPVPALVAQGVSTSGIAGTVSVDDGSTVEIHVRAVHQASGFAVEARASHGRFLIEGLEPGGPYTVTARALGFSPARLAGIQPALGERREVALVLHRLAARLDTMAVVGRAADRAPDDGGTAMTISDSMIDRLPTLNRDLYDFLRLVPQISTQIGLPNPGISAAGMNFRLNNFLINGVSERTLSGGVSNAFGGVRSVPLDAVREYQVLLAPYDVRYGDFAGALVNTVTKSGTNELRGSAFVFGRTDHLARGGDLAPATSYERAQYGFSIGGPIVRDRLHFFVAPELQRFAYPASGPYLGQPPTMEPRPPVDVAALARFDSIMRRSGLTAGSAGPIELGNPQHNLFTRLDLALPKWNSRLAVWDNWGTSDDRALSRASRDTFSLSSYEVTRRSRGNVATVQLHTALQRAGGGHNELLVSRSANGLDGVSGVEEPIIRVSVPSTSGGRVTLNSGTHETAQHSDFTSRSFALRDHLILPIGSVHVATLGAEIERFAIRRGTGAGSYGTWNFASLDDFSLGVADRYDVTVGYEQTQAELRGHQYAAYVGDQWRVTRGLSLTAGLRADMLAIDGHAPAQPLIDTLFGRRTDEMPRRRVELSPRLGFDWDVAGGGEHRLRGGLGVFTGRYPLAWAHAALSSYGAASGALRCSASGTLARQPPPFSPDVRSPPTACAGGASIGPAFHGDVDLLDRDLRMARVARGSVAYEWRLPQRLLLTNEALVTRSLADFVFVNLNLPDSAGADANGRVMYGTIGPTGAATIRTRSDFSEVIDLRSAGLGHSYQLSTRLESTRTAGLGGFVSYTYSRVRDVETPLRVNTRGTAAWASARVVSGRHDDLSVTRSSNDIPHRVVVAGTYTAPWRRAATALAFYYVGESGRPFTYVASGTLGRGDLNADGSNANDPIYVPRSAMDTTEIAFSGRSDSIAADNSPATQATRVLAQQDAFERRIERTACLSRQRGRILERNSCREPWSHTTIASLRQWIPVGRRTLEAEMEVFNLLNLVNASWGRRREAAPGLLEHVGEVSDSTQGSQPVFRFDAKAPDWTTVQQQSAFQLQLALRYRF